MNISIFGLGYVGCVSLGCLAQNGHNVIGVDVNKINKKNNIDFAVVDNPEFLREGSAVQDYYNPPLTLIGSNSDAASEKMRSLYAQLPGEIIITDVKIAEIMKYVNNTFHALKIS